MKSLREETPDITTDTKGKRVVRLHLPGLDNRASATSCRWSPPPLGVLKVNVDGAFNPTSGAARLEVIIRDHQGQVLLTAWRVLFHCRDAEEAEAAACLDGILLAGRWPDKPVLLESDCASVVAKVLATEDRSLVGAIIKDVKWEAALYPGFEMVKVERKQNRVAHELAQVACRLSQSRVSFSCVPDCVQDLVLSERLFCNDVP